MKDKNTKTTEGTHHFVLIDCRTGLQTSGKYSTLRSAHNAADRLDSAYGAVRFSVQREMVEAI
jgi:hypothetical protein